MIIKTPAKLHLFLEILKKRKDGYHEIRSIMIPIDLYDDIFLEKADNGIRLQCSDPSLPTDERNLAFKAASLYLKEADIKEGVYINIKKRIPVSAGLGGGSSDAAAVLKGLNKIYQKFSEKELLEMARHIGADVPFFLYSAPCLAMGIGEILEPLCPHTLHFLLITPHIQVSTAWAYREYDKLHLTKSEQSSIKKRWKKGDIKALLKNDLERVTIRSFPVIEELKILLLRKGAKGVLMSGSGPTVFGIFESRQDANRVANELPADIGKLFVASSLNKKAWGVAKR
ncbi:MAG: 4-(cytidine 5'-diphospho)-2-C-methyl-D-erythritol kinase [Deltaproteobacteria bacterium]|nr:MAG: 4-(cytidine 5'-diphospho)-2-C-methyl-D-erythritol kinase [Deltaproteobacteria bacterium]